MTRSTLIRRTGACCRAAVLLASLGAIGATFAIEAAPQTPYETINAAAAASDITVQPIRGGLSLLGGSGGNIVALVGDDGTLLVDTGIAVSKPRIESALGTLNSRRLRYAINTHWHWDHTDGNAWVRAAGATVFAHPNTIRSLSRTLRVVEWGHTFTPVTARDRPTEAVHEERALQLNGHTVQLHPYAPGHTDGDLAVRFVEADVLAVGDTFWNGHYPFIDYVAGGSIDGLIRQAEASLALATDRTIIVPGHGPLATRSDLVGYRDMLVDVRTRVAELKRQGRSLEEVIAARPTAAYDDRWGTLVISGALFTELVYRGV